MRKQEYIHLHALLNTTSQHLIREAGMPSEQISAYHQLDASPNSIQKSKQQHHDAVMTLATQIGTWAKETHPKPELPAP